MRYFTKELWLKINSRDQSLRKAAEKKWEENSRLYQERFEEAKKRLSNDFVDKYMVRNGLHDYYILNITIRKEKQDYLCELQLSNEIESVLITMIGVKSIQLNVDSFQNCIQGKLSWSYDEFEITPNNSFVLSILCDLQNELQFEFQSIKMTGGQGDGLREP